MFFIWFSSVKMIFISKNKIIIMRLFIAIEIEKEIINRIEEKMKQFRNDDFDIKFVEPENLHLTLKFLGEVDEDNINDIQNIISKTVKKFKPFKISLEKMGFFGRRDYIKILWIDIIEGCETIKKIISNLNESMKHIRREVREPSPHLTLGRVKSGKNRDKLIHMIDLNQNVKFGEMYVKFVKLKSSILNINGPVYTDLKSFELGE